MAPTPFGPSTKMVCAVEFTLIVYLLPQSLVKLDSWISWVEGYNGSPAFTHKFC
jgi:hypothetical protein